MLKRLAHAERLGSLPRGEVASVGWSDYCIMKSESDSTF